MDDRTVLVDCWLAVVVSGMQREARFWINATNAVQWKRCM